MALISLRRTERAAFGRSLALVTFLALLAPLPLWGDAKEAYRRGHEAIAQKRWDEAARQFRQAIAERPEADAGVLGVFRRYTPHYWLGVALAEHGECRGAVEAFAVAEGQGKLSKEEARDLVLRRVGCQKRIVRSAEAVAQAQKEVDAAAAAAFQVAGVESSPVMRGAWHEGNPSFASRQQPATARLAAARAQLGRADQELDADKAAEAGRSAQQARQELEALLGEATTRRDALQVEVQGELAALGKTVEEGRRDVSFVSRSLAPLPSAIANQRTRVEEGLTRAAAADMGTALADIRRLHDALRLSLRELRTAVKPPPEALQRAAAAYLAGDYAGALAQLEAAKYTEPRAAAHACLLRAASLHGLQQLGDAAGGAAAPQARDELRRCVALPASVKPIPAAFPPSFVALYDAVAAEPRQPGG